MHAHCSMPSVTETVEWVPKTVRVSVVYNCLEMLYCFIGGIIGNRSARARGVAEYATEME